MMDDKINGVEKDSFMGIDQPAEPKNNNQPN